MKKTHNESPWRNAPDGGVIDVKEMGEYYGKRVKFCGVNKVSQACLYNG